MDVNRDGLTNMFDAFIVYQYINTNPQQIVNRYIWETYKKPIYDLLYDINVDGIVNESDYNIIWEYTKTL